MDDLLTSGGVVGLLGTLVGANAAVTYALIRLLPRLFTRGEKAEAAFLAALQARDEAAERERDKDRESRHYLATRVEVLSGVTQRLADTLPVKIAEALRVVPCLREGGEGR